MTDVNKYPAHPSESKEGVMLWQRPTCYVVGDRVRRTVLWICNDVVLELTPEAASLLANEMLVHSRDVRQDDDPLPAPTGPDHE